MNEPDYATLVNATGTMEQLIVAMGFPGGGRPTPAAVENRAQQLSQDVMLNFPAGAERDQILQVLEEICTSFRNASLPSGASVSAPPDPLPAPATPSLGMASSLIPQGSLSSRPPSSLPVPGVNVTGDPFDHPIIKHARATFSFWKGAVYFVVLLPAIAMAISGAAPGVVIASSLVLPFVLFRIFDLDIFEEPQIQKRKNPGAYWAINLITFFCYVIGGTIVNAMSGLITFTAIALAVIMLSPATNISRILTGRKSYKLLWAEKSFSDTAQVALNATRFFPGFQAEYIDAQVAEEIMKGKRKASPADFKEREN